MMKNLILAFLLIVPFSLYSQSKNIGEEQLNVHFIEYDNDTIDFEIKNISLDTFYVSIYIEMLNYKNDTLKLNRDIFSKPEDFHGTLVIMVLPKETKRIKTRITDENIYDIIIDNKKKLFKQVQSDKYRLLVKANISSLDGKLYEFYSDWFSANSPIDSGSVSDWKLKF